jgi:hypothetical protein
MATIDRMSLAEDARKMARDPIKREGWFAQYGNDLGMALLESEWENHVFRQAIQRYIGDPDAWLETMRRAKK